MPIHDQSYRRYRGGKATPGHAWLVIASAGIRTMLRKRAFLGVLLFAWGPFIVRAVQIYVTTNYRQVAAAFGVNAQTFRDFLAQQDFFVFIVTIYVGAGLIANDRRANALQIYLSKPLMRTEYIVGKAAVLFSFLLLVTWVPAMLLLFLQVVLQGSFEFVKTNLFLFPAITVASFLQALLATFTMLALSSLSKSSRYVGILYAGIIFFSAAVYGALYAITGDRRCRGCRWGRARRRSSTSSSGSHRATLRPGKSRSSSSSDSSRCPFRCSSGASGAWRWSHDRSDRRFSGCGRDPNLLARRS